VTYTRADVAKLKLCVDALKNPEEVRKIESTMEKIETERQHPREWVQITPCPDEKERLRRLIVNSLVSGGLRKKGESIVALPAILTALESMIEYLTARPPPDNINWLFVERR
jgi:hypothetical protein